MSTDILDIITNVSITYLYAADTVAASIRIDRLNLCEILPNWYYMETDDGGSNHGIYGRY